MVVDESPDHRQMLGAHLSHSDYEVVEAASAADALELCRLRKPDFILSDWLMAGMTGPDLCRAVRKAQGDAYIYFILLTTKAEPDDIAFGLENGADDFLTKPITPGELLARLRAAERILQLKDQAQRANAQLTKTLEALRHVQAAMERDLNEARRLQQGLIGERQAKFGGFSVSNILRPAGHVGGDLTGSFAINARRFGVFAIDVSGHGVAAALLTARLATQFSASVDQNAALFIDEYGLYESRTPAVLARYLNHLMLADLRTDSYFTMVYAVIDQMTGEVRMVQAGHPHPIVQRANGEVEVLGQGGLPIGVIDNAEYEEISLRLDPGDRLLIASDGLWDATDQAGRMLGLEGLSAIMQTNSATTGVGLVEAMVWSVLAYAGGKQCDDMSAVLIEHIGLPP
jgi:sigma-B regulation protein RsbU (phosphoserine phosphatase)